MPHWCRKKSVPVFPCFTVHRYKKGKSLCQLYGISFERLLPLNLPPLTPAQTDPEQLLPITLVEVADQPCSSKFSANSQLIKSIEAATRETLALIPRPSAQKKVNREDGEATRKKANDDDAEESRGGTDEGELMNGNVLS